MRILYSFPSQLGAPGVGTTAWHHVVGLADQGASVTVVCPQTVQPPPNSVKVIETLKLGPTRIPLGALERIPGFKVNSWHDRKVAAYLARESRNFDIVHCWPLSAEQTVSTAVGHGVTGILERPNAHTDTAYTEVETAYRELGIPVDPLDTHARDRGKLAIEEREYRLAHRILCPSQFVMDSFLKRGFPQDQLSLTGRGYDPERFNTVGRRASIGPLNVCFLGSGGPRKGLHYALKAWFDSGASEAGGRFRFAGHLVPSYRAFLAPMLGHHSVDDLGFVSKPEDIMRSCDVLVLASVEEASAKVTYEARACGCVLAVSDRSSCPARHGVDAMIHTSGDVDQLTEHLRIFAKDRQLLEGMRLRSLEAARTQTWSDAAAVLMRTYRDAMTEPKGSAARTGDI